jgi:pentatricopeptide repeat protein
MDKVEEILRETVVRAVLPDSKTYNNLIHGYCTLGRWRHAVRVFKEMAKRGVLPDAATWNVLMDSLCKHGSTTQARYHLSSD